MQLLCEVLLLQVALVSFWLGHLGGCTYLCFDMGKSMSSVREGSENQTKERGLKEYTKIK